jgi:hypothetical protein
MYNQIRFLLAIIIQKTSDGTSYQNKQAHKNTHTRWDIAKYVLTVYTHEKLE